MGEVYRARHAKLRRDVAIKIIPSGQTEAGGGTASNLIVVQNWQEELKRLVPTKLRDARQLNRWAGLKRRPFGAFRARIPVRI